MDSNAMLGCMVSSYAVSIGIVWYDYAMQGATSISQIICKHRAGVIVSMALMAASTCAYEYLRVKHAPSHHVEIYKMGFACIVALLVCIFSLVSIDETHFVHYVFAVTGFGAIMGFIGVHSVLLQTPVCAATAAVQFASCAHMVHQFERNGDIFGGEVAFIGAFALFYFYLHYCNHSCCGKHGKHCPNAAIKIF